MFLLVLGSCALALGLGHRVSAPPSPAPQRLTTSACHLVRDLPRSYSSGKESLGLYLSLHYSGGRLFKAFASLECLRSRQGFVQTGPTTEGGSFRSPAVTATFLLCRHPVDTRGSTQSECTRNLRLPPGMLNWPTSHTALSSLLKI